MGAFTVDRPIWCLDAAGSFVAAGGASGLTGSEDAKGGP